MSKRLVKAFVNVFQQSVCHVCEAQSMRLSPVSLQNTRLLGTKTSSGTILLIHLRSFML